MLEDRFYDICRQTYPFKVLVHANYEAKQTLVAKKITPAIFLSPFYLKKQQYSMEICYGSKQKVYKPMPEISTVDFDEYQKYSDEVVNSTIKRTIVTSQCKNPKNISKQSFNSRQSVENYLNNLNFHWFEKSIKQFFYSLTLQENNFKKSTLQQPKGLAFIIQVNNKTLNENFQKMRKQIDPVLKRMYYLNPIQLKSIPLLVVVLYDSKKGHTFTDAKNYTDKLKSDFGIESVLHSKLQVGGQEVIDSLVWSNYAKPIFHFDYDLTASDPIKLLNESGMKNMNDAINIHKERIKKMIESRLQTLLKKYDEHYSMGNRFFGFFKPSSASNQKQLSTQEAYAREIADFMFVLEDYKKANDSYKNILKDFEKRDSSIEMSLRFMMSLCNEMGKFQGIKLHNSLPSNVINRQIDFLQEYEKLGKTEVIKFLTLILFEMHTFKLFDSALVKQKFHPAVKRAMVMHDDRKPSSSIEDKKATPFLIPLLLYEQYSNLNLLYPFIDYRRYCYDCVRVSMKFSEYKIHSHALRCLMIVEGLYENTFMIVLKFVKIHLSTTHLECRNFEQSLKSLKCAWTILSEISPDDVRSEEFRKMVSNNYKIVSELEKLCPQVLKETENQELLVPIVSGVDVIVSGANDLQEVDRTGPSWSQISENFNENTEIYSEGYNKNSMEKDFKILDCASSEEKQLVYRAKSSQTTPNVAARNSRKSFIEEPILICFTFFNPFVVDIEISNIVLHVSPESPKFILQNNSSHEKLAIKSHKKVDVHFKVIPTETGLFQVSGCEWSFERMRIRHGLKGYNETQQQLKPFYYTLKIEEAKGKLKVHQELERQFCEGQITRKTVKLQNVGRQQIETVYIAYGCDDFYQKRYEKIEIGLKPKQIKQLTFQLKIPLVPKNISKDWRLMDKKIFLYKTNGEFRISRSFNITMVNKLLYQQITCEKLSTHLHLLTYTHNKSNARSSLIETMIIKAGFEISKIDKAQLQQITTYYFFLRKNQHAIFECYSFKTKSIVKDVRTLGNQYSQLIKVIPKESEEEIDLVFGWVKQPERSGLIHINSLHITPLKEQILPFSFSTTMPYNVTHNFANNPILEIPFQIRIKNIFLKNAIKIWIYFKEENIINGILWEGITERNFTLKHSEQINFDITLVVSKQGVFDISQCLSYIVEGEKRVSNITHSQHEQILLHVTDSSANVVPSRKNANQQSKMMKKAVNYSLEEETLLMDSQNESKISMLASPRRNLELLEMEEKKKEENNRKTENLLDL